MRDKAKPPKSEKPAKSGDLSGNNLSEGDLALWNRLAGTATPLPETRRAYHIAAASARPAPPKPFHAQGRKQAAPIADKQAKPAPPKRALVPEARIDPNLRRRLQKNRQPIDATLDLHGMTAAQAQKSLTQFIMAQSAAGHKFVLLVTGKGAGGKGVLRRLVPEWLNMAPLSPYIVAFGAAAVVHGGSGALYVHLRTKRAGSDGRASNAAR